MLFSVYISWCHSNSQLTWRHWIRRIQQGSSVKPQPRATKSLLLWPSDCETALHSRFVVFSIWFLNFVTLTLQQVPYSVHKPYIQNIEWWANEQERGRWSAGEVEIRDGIKHCETERVNKTEQRKIEREQYKETDREKLSERKGEWWDFQDNHIKRSKVK